MTTKRKMVVVDNVWVYDDTRLPVPHDLSGRVNEPLCPNCDEFPTLEGHDACLGTLNGIMNACCGHGDKEQAYVQFWDGHCVDGEDAAVILDILKKGTQDIFKAIGREEGSIYEV